MKITTKLEIGDSVFFLHESKVISSILREMKVFITADKVEILCICNSEPDARVGIKVNESLCFKSKKELLESL